jgi:class 3 adenylate cyclase/alpha-beta hydrolase superfamily lysophospholipase
MDQDIRFCKASDGIRIAYAVTGSGYPLVWAPGWVSHLELMWEYDDFRAGFEELSRDFTLVRYDKRGTGLSQRGITDFSWGVRGLDIEAVADDLGLDRFALYGISEGCIAAMMYAGTHPDRVSHLILSGVAAPNPRTQDLLGGVVSVIKAEWGLGSKLMSDVLLGDKATPELQAVFARLQREGASADEAGAMMAANIARDPTAPAVVANITCPKLLINGREDNVAPVEDARAMAASIGARYMSRVGGHVPNREQSIIEHRAIVDFVLGHQEPPPPPAPAAQPQSGTRTVLFTDLVGHTEMMQRLGDAKGRDVLREHERITRETLNVHGGAEVKTMGDGFMASFGSVTRAVDCAIALQRAFAARGEKGGEPLSVRVGLNAGEPIEEDGDLFGATVILASRIAARAGAGEILVPDTVRGLLSGKGYMFGDRGEFVPKGFDEGVRLWDVRWRE